MGINQFGEVNDVDENIPNILNEIAEAGNGTIDEVGLLPDGSGFATMYFPLRKDHWLYQQDETPAGFTSNVPPMPFRMGQWSKCAIVIGPDLEKNGDAGLIRFIDRQQFAHAIRAAGKYAVRCATMNGAETDFDPDALLQNLVVGFLGYWTEDGLTGCAEDAAWCDPQKPFDFGTGESRPKFCELCTPEGNCPVHSQQQTSAPMPPSEVPE